MLQKVFKQHSFLLHIASQQNLLTISTKITNNYNKNNVLLAIKIVMKNKFCHIITCNKIYQLFQQKSHTITTINSRGFNILTLIRNVLAIFFRRFICKKTPLFKKKHKRSQQTYAFCSIWKSTQKYYHKTGVFNDEYANSDGNKRSLIRLYRRASTSCPCRR